MAHSDISERLPALLAGSPSRTAWSPRLLDLVQSLCSALLLAFAASFSAWLRFGVPLHPQDHLLLVSVALLLHQFSSRLLGVYRPGSEQSGGQRLGRTLGAWTLSVAGLIVLCYAARTTNDTSRLWVLSWWLLGGAGLVLNHFIFERMRGWALAEGHLRRHALLVVPAAERRAMVDVLSNLDPSLVLHPLSVEEDAEPQTVADQILTESASMTRRPLDSVILAPPLHDRHVYDAYIQAFRFMPAEVCVAPPLHTLERALDSGVTGCIPMLETVARRPLSEEEQLAKRCIDLIGAVLLLLLCGPLMLVIALLIKLDSPGPVLFIQDRVGYGKVMFRVRKFRTMTVDACRSGNGSHVAQAVRQDPRVTRVGRFLRRSSLDELPQLLNVLTGEMSLVGPRPHAVAHDRQFSQQIRRYMARQRVKPGMTGLAQVYGSRGEIRGPGELDRRIELDLAYLENWSLLLDLKILLRTFLVVFRLDAY